MSKSQRRRALGTAVSDVLARIGRRFGFRGNQEGHLKTVLELLETRQMLSVPAAPDGISVSSNQPGSISVYWTDRSANESSFVVEYATNYEFTYDVATYTVGGDMTTNQPESVAIYGLPQSAQYYARVRAVNAEGNSANTSVAGPVTVARNSPPSDTPTGFSAPSVTASQVQLAWTDVTAGYYGYPPNDSGYLLERSTSPQFTENYARFYPGQDASTFNDATVQEDTTYYYRLWSRSWSGWSHGAVTITVSTPSSNEAPTVAVPAAATPSPVSGRTAVLSVLGADDGGESILTYAWDVVAKPQWAPFPTYTENGTNGAKATTATFHQAGDYTFVVTISDAKGASVTDSVTVTVGQTAEEVVVSTPDRITGGSSVQFTATAMDQFGDPMSVQPAFTWQIDVGSGTIDGSGLYTPAVGETGDISVRAGGAGLVGRGVAVMMFSGTASVDEGSPYTLHLLHDPAQVSGWSIEWGDGQQQSVGAVPMVQHTYAAAASRDIRVTAHMVGGLHDWGYVGKDIIGGYAREIAVQPNSDGAVVVGGGVYDPSGYRQTLVLERFKDGAVDTTFGEQGVVQEPFGGDGVWDMFVDMAMQPDGRIVVLSQYSSGGGYDFQLYGLLRRYTVDGLPDGSFGNNGIVRLPEDSGPQQVVVQLDGGVVVATSLHDNLCYLVRYTRDGVRDWGFGENGIAVVPTDGEAWVSSLIADTTGHLLVGTSLYLDELYPRIIDSSYDFELARYTPDGHLDSTFGNGGTRSIDFGGQEQATSLALAADGSVVIGGISELLISTEGCTRRSLAIARLLPGGQLDSSFGEGGRVLTRPMISLHSPRVAVDGTGRVVVVDLSMLARFGADGSVDIDFGQNGLAHTFVNTNGIAIQQDGKILLGYDEVGYGPRMVRHRTDGVMDVQNLAIAARVAIRNVAPVLSGIEPTALTYNENQAAITATSALLVSDAGNTTLAGATVQITGNYQNGQDVLSVTSVGGIEATWDAATGTLSLSGSYTLMAYQVALRAVKYYNSNENPSTLTRTLSFTVSDGLASSNTLTRQITVAAANDTPTLTSVTTLTGAVEDQDFTISYAALAAAANEADVDGGSLSFRIQAVSSGTLTKGGVAVTPGVTLLSSGESLVWRGVNNANGTLNAFTVVAWDGTLASTPAVQVQVQVAPVNDAPTLTSVTTLTGAVEDQDFTISYAALAAAANEADVDGGSLSFRIQAVSSGTLTKGGVAVTPGVTLLSSGESLVWRGVNNANGTLNAFTVVAWDGALASTAAAQVQVQVAAVNDAPVLSGSITADPANIYQEGQTLRFTCPAATDVDAGDTISYVWSVTKNGMAFPSGAASGTALEFIPNDNGSYVVSVQARDVAGALSVATLTTDPPAVGNIAPTATLSNDGPIPESGSGTVAFTDQSDASSADVTAGLRYSFDFGGDGSWEIVDGTAASVAIPAIYLANGPVSFPVVGRIADKDGGSTQYTTTVQVKAGDPFVLRAGTGDFMVVDDDQGRGCDVILGTARQGDKVVAVGYASDDIVVTRLNADGTLDTAFGNNGRRIFDLGGREIAYAVTIDSANRIIVGGSRDYNLLAMRLTPEGVLDATFSDSTNNGINDGTGWAMAVFSGVSVLGYAVGVDTSNRVVVTGYGSDGRIPVARFTATGVLDSSFGSGGKVLDTVGVGQAVATLADSSVLIGGYYTNGSEYTDFRLVKYTSTGLLVSGFGTGGVASTSIGSGVHDQIYAMQVLADSTIVVGGTSAGNYALAKFTPLGVLDASFDGDGKFTQDVHGTDYIRSLRILGDGRIVAMGYSGTDFSAMRISSTGVLDTTFNTSGKVYASIGNIDQAIAGEVLADGRLILAGHADYEVAFARFSANGVPDASYGAGGRIWLADPGLGYDAATSVALQADGKLVMAGYAGYGAALAGANQGFLVERYTQAGALDTTFGNGGRVITSFESTAASYGALTTTIFAQAHSVIVQSDQKIIVAGQVAYNFILVRYLSDGSLDTGFGDGGVAKVDLGGVDVARSVVRTADGKYVLAGYTTAAATAGAPGGSNYKYAVIRLNTNGSLDTTFGTSGKTSVDVTPGAASYGYDAAQQSDGSIVVVGRANTNMGAVRLTSGGLPDNTFGSAGVAIVDVQSASVDVANSVQVVTVGGTERIVMAGFSGGDATLVRLQANGTPDTTFGTTGISRVGGGSGSFADLQVFADGRLIATGSGGGNVIAYRFMAEGQVDTTFGVNGMLVRDLGTGGDEGLGSVVLSSGDVVVVGRRDRDLAWVLMRPPTLATTPEGGSYVFSAAPVAGTTATVNWGDGSATQAFTGSSVSHVYADGPYLRTLTATYSAGGRSLSVNLPVSVSNVAPRGELRNSGPANEGSAVAVSFVAVTDPSSADTASGFRYSYDFNNDGDFADSGDIVNGTAPSVSVPSSYLADGPATRVVRGRIQDKDGAFTDYTTTITINNAKPLLTVLPIPSQVEARETLTISGSFTDPGVVDTHTVTVNWGNGHVSSAAVDPQTRTFTASRRYWDDDSTRDVDLNATITVTIADKDGASDQKTHAIKVIYNHYPIIDSVPVTSWTEAGTPGTSLGPVSLPGQTCAVAVDISLLPDATTTQQVQVTVPAQSVAPTMAVDVFFLIDDTSSFAAVASGLAAKLSDVIRQLRLTYPHLSLGVGIGRYAEYAESVQHTEQWQQECARMRRPFTLNQPIVVLQDNDFTGSSSIPTVAEAAITEALGRKNQGFMGAGFVPLYDGRQAAIEALYQVATGAGLDGGGNGTKTDSGLAGSLDLQTHTNWGRDVPPFNTYHPDPQTAELTPSGSIGGVGFRRGATPLIILATDSPLEYQPTREEANRLRTGASLPDVVGHTAQGSVSVPFADFTHGVRFGEVGGDARMLLGTNGTNPVAGGASLQATVNALNTINARVIGLGADTFYNELVEIDGVPTLVQKPLFSEDGTVTPADQDPRRMLEALAKVTGAVNTSETPLDSNQGNGDLIDSGEPLYFRIDIDVDPVTGISRGVSVDSLAKGIGAAIGAGIAAAVTTDVEIVASDSSVLVAAAPGTALAIAQGQPATFSVTFTGNTQPHNFDLLFVQHGTGVMLGSIPVAVTQTYAYEMHATDPDGNMLAYRLVSADPAAVGAHMEGATLIWQGPVARTAPYLFVLAADDGHGGVVEQTFTVTVGALSRSHVPTIFEGMPEQPVVYVGHEHEFTVGGLDIEGHALQYFLSGAPQGMTINRDSGLIEWEPTRDQIGVHEITLHVFDSVGGHVTQTVNWQVMLSPAPNYAPQVVSTPQSWTFHGRLYGYDIIGIDANLDPLTYRFDQDEFGNDIHPEGMTLDQQTGSIVWITTPEQVGTTQRITVFVSDGRADPVEHTFDVTVYVMPEAPTGLTVQGESLTRIAIEWDAVPEGTGRAAIAGYNLYRTISILHEDPIPVVPSYTKLNQELIASTEWLDSELFYAGNMSYVYVVTAVSTDGFESQPSQPVGGTPLYYDFSQRPAKPTGLRATNTADGILLQWNPNSELDLAGYAIYSNADANGNYLLLAQVSANEYLDRTVPGGAHVYYALVAVDLDGDTSDPNDPATIDIIRTGDDPGVVRVPAPTGLTASPLFSVAVALAWDNDPAMQGYVLYRTDTTTGQVTRIPSNYAQCLPPSSLVGLYERVDFGLEPGRTYSYTVQTFNADGDPSYESAPVQVATLALPPAPATLTATAESGTRVKLAWSAVSAPDILGYDVLRADSAAGPFWSILPEGQVVTDTQYYDQTCSPSTRYWYRIEAARGTPGAIFDYSDPSPTAEVTTRSVASRPMAPANLRAGYAGQGRVGLTWDLVLNPWLLGYDVYRSTIPNFAPSAGSLIGSSPDNLYVDDGRTDGKVYYYRVVAVNDGGDGNELFSEPSEAVAVDTGAAVGAPTPAPGELAASVIRGDLVTLVWHDSSLNETQFDIYRRELGASVWGPAIGHVTVNVTTFDDTAVTPDTQYEYRVAAHNSAGDAFSSVLLVTTPSVGDAPAQPGNLHVVAASTTWSQLVLEWDAVSGTPAAAGYYVYRSISASGPFERLTSQPQASTTFTDTGLNENTTYYYQVRAVSSTNSQSAPAQTSGTTVLAASAPPVAQITSPVGSTNQPAGISGQTAIHGLVDDVNTSESVTWTLRLHPLDIAGAQDITLTSGSSRVGSARSGTSALLYTLDPTLFPSGAYHLVLVASDGTHTTQSQSVRVNITSDIKLGNFVLPVTDLTVSVPGMTPIVLSRVYDSQRAHTDAGDFGYGWTLQMRDTGLRTTARPTQRSGNGVGFRMGDLVYVTLPTGEQHAFQFVPKHLDEWNGSSLYFFYSPRFIAVDGSAAKLEVDQELTGGVDDGSPIVLTYDDVYDEYYAATTSGELAYNPALAAFGRKYVLTTQDGTEYDVSATTGKIDTATDSNGNTTRFDDTSTTGGGNQNQLVINRSGGRIDSASGPSGVAIRYFYDSYQVGGAMQTNLLGTIDRMGSRTTYIYGDRFTYITNGVMAQSVYAIVAHQSDGAIWNSTSRTFEPRDDAHLGSYAISLTAVSDGAGHLWYTGAIPDGIVDGTSLAISYHLKSGAIAATTDTVLSTESRSKAPAHFIVGIVDARGVRVLSAEYDPATRQLTHLSDGGNHTGGISDGGYDGNQAHRIVTDVFGNRTELFMDRRGNTIREIKEVKNSSGTLTHYLVTARVYSYSTATEVDEEEGTCDANVLLATSEGVPFQIAAPDTAGTRYSASPAAWASMTSYDHRTRTLYSTTDAIGHVTTYEDYVLGKPRRVTDWQGNITTFEYDSAGNRTLVINSNGQVTRSTYTAHVYPPQAYVYLDGTTIDGATLGALPQGLPLETWIERPDGTKILQARNRYYTSGANCGRISSSTNASGVETFYTYNANGQVEESYHLWTDPANAANKRWIWNRTDYDGAGRATWSSRAVRQYVPGQTGPGPVIGVELATGTHYNVAGQVDWTTDEYGRPTFFHYDLQGNQVETVYPDGTVTRSVFDAMGRAIWVSDRYNPAGTAVPSGTYTLYDSLGRATQTSRYVGVDIQVAVNPVYTDVYDVTFTPPAVSAEFSRCITFYNDKGQVAEVVGPFDPAVTTDLRYAPRTAYAYYDDGRLQYTGPVHVTPEFYMGPPQGAPPALGAFAFSAGGSYATNPGATTYRYDVEEGYTDTGGAPRKRSYDETIDALGRITRTYKPYRYNGLMVARVDKFGDWTTNDDDLTSETRTSFDGKHVTKVEARKLPLPGGPSVREIATDYDYDDQGRLTDVYLPDPDPMDAVSERPHWQYEYDAYGNQTAQIDPYGHRTVFTHDEQGRRRTRTLPAVEGNDGQMHTVTEYSFYDEFGRLRAESDFAGNLTVYSYSSGDATFGQVETETVYAKVQVSALLSEAVGEAVTDWRQVATDTLDLTPVLTHADSRLPGYFSSQIWTTVVSNLDGTRLHEVRAYQDSNNDGVYHASEAVRVETTHIDSQGRATWIETPEGTINYEYHRHSGQLKRTYTTSTDIEYRYDELGRLVRVTAWKLAGTVYSSGLITKYVYDSVGNLQSTYSPSGDTQYTYDGHNRLDLEQVHAGGRTITYDYVVLPNGLRDHVVEREYNSSNMVVRSVKVDWAYDDLGRLVSEVRDAGPTQVGPSGTLGTRDAGDYADFYAMDLVGNRVSKIHGWDTDGDGMLEAGEVVDEDIVYHYNERDQLISEGIDADQNAIPDLATAAVYGYDDNGGQTLKSTASGDTIYRWDLRGRMVGVDANGDGDTSDAGDTVYRYDASGVRVAETTGGQTTFYLQDRRNPTGYAKAVEERADTDGSGVADTTLRAYVIGHQVIAQRNATGDVYYLTTDGHGSTRALASSSAIMERYEYDAYGKLLSFSGTPLTNWLFGGDGIYDPASGWTYHLARWRDGFRFTSYDSFEADPSSPIDLHKYAYVGASPTNFVDPTGQFLDMISLMASMATKAAGDSGDAGASLPVLNVARSLNVAMKFYNGASSAWDLISTLADFTNLADLSGAERAAFTAGLSGLSSLGLHVSLPTITIPVPATLVSKLKKRVGPLWDTPPMTALIGAACAALVTTMLGWETTTIAAAYTGVDAIMKSPTLGYAVVESKGGSSKLEMTADDRQMYDKWIERRIEKALRENLKAADHAGLSAVKGGPLLAAVISTDLTGSRPYIAIKVQTFKGIKSWGRPFE